MTLLEITNKLRSLTLTPGELSDIRLKLSAEYSWIASRLEDIEKVEPKEWLNIRESVKSDKIADYKWKSTAQGQEQTVYKSQLKSIEKMMSSIKTRLEVMSQEARNQY